MKQVIQAGELAGISTADIKVILDTLGEELKTYSMSTKPPLMGLRIHQLLTQLTGCNDPYRKVKRESNQKALKAYPVMKRIVASAEDPLFTAVQIACGGNIIDYGAFSARSLSVSKEIEKILKIEEEVISHERPELFNFQSFCSSLDQAENLLYIGDNCGEIVFDRVLIECIADRYPNIDITFVTRGEPILNDCLAEDAEACGLGEHAEIISSGVPSPGLLLEQASEECRQLFDHADLILSKGQGNYEALSDQCGSIFFLLVSKCEVISFDIGCELGDLILKSHNQPRPMEG